VCGYSGLSPCQDLAHSRASPPSKPDTGKQDDGIDMEVFEQILELDDDDDDFSRGMVKEYFSQAEKTFNEMDDALCG
jgi:hypothetical protein